MTIEIITFTGYMIFAYNPVPILPDLDLNKPIRMTINPYEYQTEKKVEKPPFKDLLKDVHELNYIYSGSASN